VKDDAASTDADDESEGPSAPAKKRKRIFEKVKESVKQTELKVFKGISHIPFNDAQEEPVRNQFLRATMPRWNKGWTRVAAVARPLTFFQRTGTRKAETLWDSHARSQGRGDVRRTVQVALQFNMRAESRGTGRPIETRLDRALRMRLWSTYLESNANGGIEEDTEPMSGLAIEAS
jgi:hypothetical protein